MEDKQIPTNGISLRVQDEGGDGPAVLFLHFSGANLMMWQSALPAFQTAYRPVLIDLRGHGQSDRPADGYDKDTMARDVVGVMDQLGIEQAHIVGSSLGAEVGLALAATHPDRVLSLVCDGALASEYGPYGTWEGTREAFDAHVTEQLAKIRAKPEAHYPSVEALLDARRELFEPMGWWGPELEAMERHGAYERDDGHWALSFGQHALADYMANYYGYRFEDDYRRVTCPVLMLPTEDEEESPAEWSAMGGLAELTPRAQIVRVAGWDHPYCWLQDAGPVSQTVLAFLSKAAP